MCLQVVFPVTVSLHWWWRARGAGNVDDDVGAVVFPWRWGRGRGRKLYRYYFLELATDRGEVHEGHRTPFAAMATEAMTAVAISCMDCLVVVDGGLFDGTGNGSRRGT